MPNTGEKHVPLEVVAQIHARHASAIGRLQLLAELARLGREYIPVLRMIDDGKPAIAHLEAYAKEQSPDFFDLHALVTARLWSILEAYVRDMCCAIIQMVPSVREQQAIVKLKAPVVQFLNSSTQEQADFLYELLESSCSAPLKAGVGRFEAVLSALGYGGPVDKKVRYHLHHMSNLRNCIVHNDGVVDKKLVEACPWWAGTEGTRVGITAKMSHKHLFAVCWYMMEIQRRVLPSDFEHMAKLVEEMESYRERIEQVPTPGKYPFA